MANKDDTIQTTIRLTATDRRSIATITKTGIAQNTAEAIRVALAALAWELIRPKPPTTPKR